MDFKVSVICPSYNHSRYIAEMVESVMAQTLPVHELIVVDDGSTDDSLAKLKSFDYPNLRVQQNEENLGTYGTLNRALDMAQGDWIAVINSDDKWAPNKIELQAFGLESTGLDWGFTLGAQITEEGEVRYVNQHGDWPREVSVDLLPYLFEENRVLASSLVFRKGLIRFDERLRYSGDWVGLMGLALHGSANCCFELPPKEDYSGPAWTGRGVLYNVEPPQIEQLTQWRQHTSNSYSRSKKQLAEEIRVRETILANADALLSRTHNQVGGRFRLGRCALHLNALYLMAGRSAQARKALKSANSYGITDNKRWVLSLMPRRISAKYLSKVGILSLEGLSTEPLDHLFPV
ncbi:MAG: glycosyltransferase family 2 protein [Armatimonadetes bacterium]|nr:glycosyltransferase family 2 protein [Armatimonadota bacterium]